MPKKILILYSRFGGGHKAAAEALAEGFSIFHSEHEITTLDFGELSGTRLNTLIARGYELTLDYAPIFYRLFFSSVNSIPRLEHLSRLTRPLIQRKIERKLQSLQPDIVITTWPGINPLLSRLKSKYHFKQITVVTDLFDLHHYWISAGTDHYLVALPETKRSLEVSGVMNEKIQVLGYPTRLAFSIAKDPQALRAKYRLDAKKFTVLYFLHTAPDKFSDEIAKKLDANPALQSIIICGNNHALKTHFEKILKSTLVVGFTREVDEYLRMCDVAIGKTGPGFLLEVATVGKPLIATRYIAPQELGNLSLLLEKKWGYFAPNSKLVLRALDEVQNLTPENRKTLAQRAQSCVRENPTQKIVDFITNFR